VIAAAMFAPLCASAAQDAAPRWFAAVDSVVRAEMARAQTPGAQIAVVQGDRVVYSKAYGVSDIESGRPVTDKTLFQIGSVAKLSTGMLLAQLATAGKVDLNAPI